MNQDQSPELPNEYTVPSIRSKLANSFNKEEFNLSKCSVTFHAEY